MGVVGNVSWSLDGRRLAYANDLGVWVLDTNSGKKHRVHGCAVGWWCGVASSPDGSQLAVVDSGVLDLIDPVDGTTIRAETHPQWSLSL